MMNSLSKHSLLAMHDSSLLLTFAYPTILFPTVEANSYLSIHAPIKLCAFHARDNVSSMGQVLNKLVINGKTRESDQKDRLYTDLMKEIEAMEPFQAVLADPAAAFNDFYDAISRIFEKLSLQRGGSHISLPDKKIIEKAFQECGGSKGHLTKEEFVEFTKKILARGIGISNHEVVAYLAGVPTTSLVIKSFMPGAISKFPNQLFIPLVTSATSIFLAHMKKI